jgi:hypothetical protein
MEKLTETQIELLAALDAGRVIAYSRDGDCGWLVGSKKMLDDRDIWALRDRQYIIQESDEREDDYGCDKITDAGRAALAPIPDERGGVS